MFSVSPENLQRLHETSSEKYDLFKVGEEHLTHFHRTFYGHVNPPLSDQKPLPPSDLGGRFLNVYEMLVRELMEAHFHEQIYFQAIPTFGIHLPNNVALAAPHRDRDVSHHPEEVNVFCPFTRAYGNNTIWAESQPDKGDFSPLEAHDGQLIVWDGANSLHRNYVNDTGVSRVCINFRLLPVSRYIKRPELTSAALGVKMEVGCYFRELL